LINRISVFLLDRLLEDIRHWRSNVKVAFNLSARSLASSDCMLQLIALIHKSGIDPKRLEFEVTETAVMIDFDASLRALNLLRNLGSSIALDDFGTGYSSLSYVHRLPLDKVKIDGGFVKNMLQEEKASNIVKTIIGMANDLKLACVAEAVETEAQSKFLQEAGCHQMQGFLYARPMPADALGKLLISNQLQSKAG
jgi:predicted signal transduction protein with EAL and GGDEF domain